MCQPTTLAGEGPFRVDRCSCGHLHLHLGPVTVRLPAGALPMLAELLATAAARAVSPPRWGGGAASDPRRN